MSPLNVFYFVQYFGKSINHGSQTKHTDGTATTAKLTNDSPVKARAGLFLGATVPLR